MSTKSKFWKKLGLGKKSSQGNLLTPTQPSVSSTTISNDDKSVKSKQFSGVFLQRKQSTNSMKHNSNDFEFIQPPVPTLPIIPAEHKENNTQLPTIEQPHVEQAQENHVEIITPPKVSDLDDTSLKVEQNNTNNNNNDKSDNNELNHIINEPDSNTSTPSPSSINDNNSDSFSVQKKPSSSSITAKQPIPKPSSSTLPSKLMKPGSISNIKKGSRSNSTSSITNKNKTNNNNSGSSIIPVSTKSTSSISSSSKSSTNNKENKSRLRQPTVTSGNNTNNSSTESSFCHVPSTTSSTTSLKKEDINNNSTTKIPTPSVLFNQMNINNVTDKDQLIQQLQDELQAQLSINRVLQGQKEAITRDLDYFSLTVDELMEEKDSLVQKYEDEKLKNLSKEEDLNILLIKLKENSDHARERSTELDSWKSEVEKTKEEAASDLEELKSVLQQRDQEISHLKNELDSANNKIESLSSEVENLTSQRDHLLDQINTNQNNLSTFTSQHSTSIDTPNPSPQLQAQKYNNEDHDDSNQDFVTPLSSFKSSHSNSFGFANQHYRNTPPSLSVVTTPHTPPSTNGLDDELLALTKAKEKIQSDYSKIPLSGGGPMTRRRKEELEDMLDEVDQQLSKVKQKIRRS
ncbi:unnamed protein product [Cunninghamella blakesleeana]